MKETKCYQCLHCGKIIKKEEIFFFEENPNIPLIYPTGLCPKCDYYANLFPIKDSFITKDPNCLTIISWKDLDGIINTKYKIAVQANNIIISEKENILISISCFQKTNIIISILSIYEFNIYYDEDVSISKFEWHYVRSLPSHWCIARDKNGTLNAFPFFPERFDDEWQKNKLVQHLQVDPDFFDFITWDNRPVTIKRLQGLEVQN